MTRAGLAMLLAAAGGWTGCASLPVPADAPHASAELQATRGNTASGKVDFYQLGDRVRLVANVSGLKPNAEHGFHVHEVGDCSAPDAMSAKGHFNPYGRPHAHYQSAIRHAGDLPALRADASGRARLDTHIDLITVTDGPTSVVGRGLVVHADPDDYRTQPTGNSGARVACAVIQRN